MTNVEEISIIKQFRDLHGMTYSLSKMSELGESYQDFSGKFVAISKNMILTHKIKEESISQYEFSQIFEQAVAVMNGAPYQIKNFYNHILSSQNTVISINLDDYFQAQPEDTSISYSVEENSNPASVNYNLDGSILTVSKSNTAGSSEIYIRAAVDSWEILSSFQVINAHNYIYDDFEGFFSNIWTFEGDANWEIAPNAFSGKNCARSGEIGDDSSTSLKTEFSVTEEGILSFYLDISTESNFDKLLLILNNEEIEEWSGEIRWFKYEKNLSPGNYTLEFKYIKDYVMSAGNDLVKLDAFIIPVNRPNNIFQDNLLLKNSYLYQNYPNPFNNTTSINFFLNQNADVKFLIFDTNGKLIDEINAGKLIKGNHNIKYNANKLSTGVYFYKLILNNYIIDNKKMILIK